MALRFHSVDGNQSEEHTMVLVPEAPPPQYTGPQSTLEPDAGLGMSHALSYGSLAAAHRDLPILYYATLQTRPLIFAACSHLGSG